MLGVEGVGTLAREGAAGLVVTAAMIAVEAVIGGVDVHGQGRVHFLKFLD